MSYGQASVWTVQVSYKPIRFIVALGHTRNTPQYVKKAKELGISWIDEPRIAKHFGRQSGAEIDKFNHPKCPRIVEIEGIPLIAESSMAVMGDVEWTRDVGSHTLFCMRARRFMKSDGNYGFLNYKYGSL